MAGLRALTLSALAGAAVLGASPAEAIVYNFENTSITWRFNPGSGPNDTTGTISGRFDYTSAPTLNSVNVSLAYQGQSSGTATYTTGTINATLNQINFGSGALIVNLATPLNGLPNNFVPIASGTTTISSDNASRNFSLTNSNAGIRSVPSPLAATILLPVAGILVRTRKRFSSCVK